MPKSKKNTSEFTSHNSRKIKGLTVLKNNHKYIRRLRSEHGYPSHHGNKVWNSSIVIMDYLNLDPISKKEQVLEVGCGWAIAAIYCAKKWQCKVAGLDIDKSVFPFAQLHAEINGVKLEEYAKSYQKASAKFLTDFDVMLGGDICFWDELSKPLYNLTRRAVDNGVRVVLADPGRPPFMKVAEKACAKLGGELFPHVVGKPYNTSAWVLEVRP